MDNAIYANLNRQSGLMREMQTVANNLANVSTAGFRREGVLFSEFLNPTGEADDPSLSMAHASGRAIDTRQGPLAQTGGTYDIAIEGEGFFQVQTPQGVQLTRAGSFTPSPEGVLVTSEGHPLLDAGGAPIFVPTEARSVAVGEDGTISADGTPLAQVGIVLPQDPTTLSHVAGTRFDPKGPVVPAEATLLQGFVEESNVDPVSEITRMIEVQRAYEMGQTLMDREDERIRSVISTLSR